MGCFDMSQNKMESPYCPHFFKPKLFSVELTPWLRDVKERFARNFFTAPSTKVSGVAGVASLLALLAAGAGLAASSASGGGGDLFFLAACLLNMLRMSPLRLAIGDFDCNCDRRLAIGLPLGDLPLPGMVAAGSILSG